MRPASNVFTGAAIPVVVQSTRTTDLMQSFVRDPQAGSNLPHFLPRIEAFPMGEDLRELGLLTAAHWELIAARPSLEVSTLFYVSRQRN
jgi:hypothetical protein